MGKINQGILGGFNGKVGTVIGSSWKGKSVMRGLPQSVKNPKTPAQMAQRVFFAQIADLVNQLSNDEIKTFFPEPVKSMTERNLLFKQLAAAQTVSNGTKTFDATKLSTLGNARGIYDFGTVHVEINMTLEGPVGLLIGYTNTQGAVLNNYGAFIVFNVTKKTVHCFNSTSKMNGFNEVPFLSEWNQNDTFKVLPFVYDSQTAVVGFGTMSVVERPARKDLSL